jgi:hypothetical protein
METRPTYQLNEKFCSDFATFMASLNSSQSFSLAVPIKHGIVESLMRLGALFFDIETVTGGCSSVSAKFSDRGQSQSVAPCVGSVRLSMNRKWSHIKSIREAGVHGQRESTSLHNKGMKQTKKSDSVQVPADSFSAMKSLIFFAPLRLNSHPLGKTLWI